MNLAATPKESGVFRTCKRLAESKHFNRFILAVIVLAGVLVGIETYHQDNDSVHGLLAVFDLLILLIFTLEAAVKILAQGNRPGKYFKDPWNAFDFAIVAVCWGTFFLPAVNSGVVAVVRLARILRVMRLVHALPQLKLLVDALLKSIPSMGYVGVLLFLLFYIYGAMGVFLFGKNDPAHFANLHTALVSLFQVVTMEGWADIMYVNIHGCDHPFHGTERCTHPQAFGAWAVLYFISFVLIGTMIVLNLFIGVIMNSMDEVRAEQALEDRSRREQRADGLKHLEDEISVLHEQLDGMKKQLDFIAFRLRKEGSG